MCTRVCTMSPALMHILELEPPSIEQSRSQQEPSKLYLLDLFLQITEKLCAFTLLAPPGLPPWPWPWVPGCLPCRVSDGFFVVRTSNSSTFHRRGLTRHCRRHRNVLLLQRSGIVGSFNFNWRLCLSDLRFCIPPACALANVRDRQDRALSPLLAPHSCVWGLALRCSHGEQSSSRPDSRFSCSHACVAPGSMLSVSRCNMMFDFQLGRPTSDRNNMGSLHLDCFIINACVNTFDFLKYSCNFSRGTRHCPKLQLLRWRLRRRAK